MIGDAFSRPRRRRRRWWLLLLVAVIVAGVGTAYSAGEEGVVAVDSVRKQTETLAAVAAPYREMLASVGTVGRLELDELTSDVLDTLAAAAEAADAADMPPELTGAVDGYRLALRSWTDGVSAFREAAFAAAESPDVPAEDLLADALLDLRAGDRLYALFVDRASEPSLPQPPLPYAPVAFLPDAFPLVGMSESIAASARAPGNPLAVVRSVTVEQVTTEPAWVVDTEGSRVVPETTSLVFKVLVANTGNTDLSPDGVTVSLRSSTGVETVTAPVDVVPAASSATVTLPALPVVAGASYEAEVRLGAVDGDDPADNVGVFAFRVNEPTPSSTTTTAGG